MLGKVLCVGLGSMGRAIVEGALQQGVLERDCVQGVVASEASAERLREELHIHVGTTMPALDQFNTVLLAVKPQILPKVWDSLQGVKPGTVLISVAAGIPLAQLEEAIPHGQWYRAMPNTPLRVQAGFTAIAVGSTSTDAVADAVESLFGALGKALRCEEEELERLGALAGAGPGYMFTIMDALANAGVRIGLRRQTAIEAAAHVLYGSGLMALSEGAHPAVLRDEVTSPGGTTIAGIETMEKGGLRSAIADGVMAAYERSKELGSKS